MKSHLNREKTAISPRREENYAEWYQRVIDAADLADHSPVRGCMVIKPWGYALWENIQKILDRKLKETGHQNGYFPLFIPLSFLEKEAEHVEGFAKECAVVTHHRLEKGKEGKLIPSGQLEEPLIVRPTSETIIGEMFAKWINSYRDLPLLINQWANVVRWEMRPRLFLRTAEFLWQEGHTAHATAQEATEEALKILHIYEELISQCLAIPLIKGKKTPQERFPGAVESYTLEAMMQDRKALQAATSHFLGQNFSQASGITFREMDGGLSHVWMTSWAITTRLIGALIMTHGDDNGIILPPRIASAHIVLIPIFHQAERKGEILCYSHLLSKELRGLLYHGEPLVVIVDEREIGGGEKSWSWIKKGIPLRLEIGLREIETHSFSLKRRDQTTHDAVIFSRKELLENILHILDDIQRNLYQRASSFVQSHTHHIDNKEEFYDFFTPKNREQPEMHAGFALSHWSGDADVEKQIQEDLGVTIRCIPLEGEKEEGACVISGKKSKQRVIYAKSY